MKYTKVEIAAQQLEAAIRLFFQRDYVSALTLAGAAEEVLGVLARRAGNQAALDWIVDFHSGDTDPNLTEGQKRKVISEVANRARNQTKHANDPNEVDVEVDLVHALQMLMRAIPMCPGLGIRLTPQMMELFEWVAAHPEHTQ